jgi:hypothetical protein
MIGSTLAAAVITKGIARISKEPDFLGPDELPMLPEFLIEQDPTEADKYHMKMKEWWESVHENLERMRDMVVSYQVADAKDAADGDLQSAKTLLSQQSQDLVESLDSALQTIINNLDASLTDTINTHTTDFVNPHSVTKTQVSLGNVENTALSTWAGSGAITNIGTISSGTVPASNTSGFHAVATSGGYSDLANKPSLFSGAYDDLSGKPSLFSGAYDDLSGKPSLFSGDYDDLLGKPSLFSGDYQDLINKPEYSYDNTTNTLTITNT